MATKSLGDNPGSAVAPPPPARPTVSPMLRESFIAIFQREGQESSLRLLAELAYQLACEGRGGYLMGKDDDAITRTEVLGAAGDLRQAADQLKESARGLTENPNEDREALRMALAIADASAAVQPLADQLDAALARYLESAEVPQ